jgi:hypothetical protein
VRRENIAKLWPLTPAAASKADNIRKFEEIGTHPAANHNAIGEALAFHQAIGTERKAARLRYLNDRWAKRVEQLPGVKILNSREPNQAWGLFNVSLASVDAPKAYEFLWTKYRIITAAIKRDDYQGLRVTPNIYTTLGEVDTFASAIEDLLKHPPTTATPGTPWHLSAITDAGLRPAPYSGSGITGCETVDADLGVLGHGRPRMPRDERQIGPPIELGDQRLVAVAAQILAVNHQVAHAVRSDGVHRRLVGKIRHRAGQPPVRGRKEAAVAVHQPLPMNVESSRPRPRQPDLVLNRRRSAVAAIAHDVRVRPAAG